jgi:IS5 family transposase
VPDATTVWLFRERLVQAKAIDKLFARFDAALKDRGYLARRADHRCHRSGAQAAQHRGREGRHQGRARTRGLETGQGAAGQDARWSIKYSKAKVREGADPKAAKPVDLAIPMFGYKIISASTRPTA